MIGNSLSWTAIGVLVFGICTAGKAQQGGGLLELKDSEACFEQALSTLDAKLEERLAKFPEFKLIEKRALDAAKKLVKSKNLLEACSVGGSSEECASKKIEESIERELKDVGLTASVQLNQKNKQFTYGMLAGTAYRDPAKTKNPYLGFRSCVQIPLVHAYDFGSAIGQLKFDARIDPNSSAEKPDSTGTFKFCRVYDMKSGALLPIDFEDPRNGFDRFQPAREEFYKNKIIQYANQSHVSIGDKKCQGSKADAEKAMAKYLDFDGSGASASDASVATKVNE